MAKGKPYRRLSLKLLAMLLLAAMAAVALGLTLRVLGDYLVQEVYCSEKRQAQRLQASISSFRAYVQEGSPPPMCKKLAPGIGSIPTFS